MEMAKPKLSKNQLKFCREYQKSWNAKQSYLKAYKCSEKAAESSSSDLLRNPKVALRLEKADVKLQEKHEFDLDRMIQERKGVLDYGKKWMDTDRPQDVQSLKDSLKEMWKLLWLYEEKIKHSWDKDNPLFDSIKIKIT